MLIVYAKYINILSIKIHVIPKFIIIGIYIETAINIADMIMQAIQVNILFFQFIFDVFLSFENNTTIERKIKIHEEHNDLIIFSVKVHSVLIILFIFFSF